MINIETVELGDAFWSQESTMAHRFEHRDYVLVSIMDSVPTCVCSYEFDNLAWKPPSQVFIEK